MNAEDYPSVQAAARLIAREPQGHVQSSAEARARAIGAMERALRARRARRRRSRFVVRLSGVLAVTAAAAAAWAMIARSGEPAAPPKTAITASVAAEGAHLAGAGGRRPLTVGAPIQRGDRVSSGAGGPAELALSTGTRLRLEAGAAIDVVEDGPTQIFGLATGSVLAEVAKLEHGARFLVRTDDTEVEVRGTAFTVEKLPPQWTCEGSSRTRVVVREGVVVVRAEGEEHILRAGTSFPSECTLRAEPPAPHASSRAHGVRAGTQPPDLGPKPEPAPRTHGVRDPSGRTAPSGFVPSAPAPIEETAAAERAALLREQNDLFAEGLAAKRRGDRQAAARTFATFVDRYPSSPLAESARAERMRASESEGARAAARAYLAHHPNGFAKREADAILRSDP